MTDGSPEIHLFLLWSEALGRADDILADIGRRFTILDAVAVEWTPELFPRSLSRLYGQALPRGSQKELECGTGPFVVVVVADRDPAYGGRVVSGRKSVVNRRMFDAKRRYRRWTGSGHRVHASLTAGEADHDLFVLLGRRSADYRPGAGAVWNGRVRTMRRDPAGTGGWRDLAEFFTAFEVTLGYVFLGDPGSLRDGGAGRNEPIRVLVERTASHWGVEWLVASPDVSVPAARAAGLRHEIVVNGRTAELELQVEGDGSLDSRWQGAMLRERVRDQAGVYVLPPRHRFHLLLHERLAGPRPEPPPERAALAQLAAELSVHQAALDDPTAARRLLDGFLSGIEAEAPAGGPGTRKLVSRFARRR